MIRHLHLFQSFVRQQITALPLYARIIGLMLVLAAVLAIGGKYVWAVGDFASGTGTVADPYVIATCTQLQNINNDLEYLAASFVLSNNIDCSGISNFNPIASTTPVTFYKSGFSGRFDGAGYTISNVTINYPAANDVGLFREMEGGTVRNVTLSNFSVTGNSNVAALVGDMNPGAVVGVTVTNATISGGAFGGGGAIAGKAWESYIYASRAQATTITGSGYLGGLVGSFSGTIERSYASTTVTGTASRIGGLLGRMVSEAVIKDSYSNSNVSGSDSVGGLVGETSSFQYRTLILNSYSSGSTTATLTGAYVGGIVGLIVSRLYIQNVFATGPVSLTTHSGGIAGQNGSFSSNFSNVYYYPTGTNQTLCEWFRTYATEECTSNDTSAYYNVSSNAPLSSWDFTNIWQTQASARPLLRGFPYTAPSSFTTVGTCAALASATRINPDGWFSLSGDIDCASDVNLIPVTGTTTYFAGNLDGNGHTISGVGSTIDIPNGQGDGEGWGLFTNIFGSNVQDVTLTGSGISVLSDNMYYIGALAGHANSSFIDNVTSTVPMIVNSYSGGLVGIMAGGEIANSHVNADIEPYFQDNEFYVGGLVGSFYPGGTIASSSYAGTLSGSYGDIGGLVGVAGGGLRISNSFSSGSVTGMERVGGLVGNIEVTAPLSVSISHSSSTATVALNTLAEPSGYVYVLGGLVGIMSYYDTPLSATNISISDSLFAGTISLPGNAGGGEQIGGLVGAMYGDTVGTMLLANSTSTAAIIATGTGGPYIDKMGGAVGYAEWATISGVYASTSMILGSSVSRIGALTHAGGLIGRLGQYATATNSHSEGSLTLYEDLTNGGYALGGFVGLTNLGSAISDSYATFTLYVSSGFSGGIGGFVGNGLGSTITGSHATGTVQVNIYEPTYIGGFAGEINNTSVSTSYTTSPLTITSGGDGSSSLLNIGGFAGSAYSNSSLTNVYSAGSLTASSSATGANAGDYIGGLVGYLDGNTSVTNAYSSGALTLTTLITTPFNYIGGLIGYSNSNANSVTNSFSAGSIPAVASSTSVGGFIGSYQGSETFSNNAYDAFRTGRSVCTGTDLVDPAWCTKRNVVNATPSFFYTQTNQPLASWNFTSIWTSHAAAFPTLETGGGAPPPTSAPSVTTDAASSVTDTAATLNGTISAIGSATPATRGFAYGATALYGATTTESGAFTTGGYTAAVASLTCATMYHVRAYATSPDGTGYGSDATFTTSACATSGGGGGSGGGSSSGRNPSSIKDVKPPQITNVKSITQEDGKVKLSWDTDEPASSQVLYGPTQCLGLSTSVADIDLDVTTKHVVVLPASACKNSTHFSAVSADASGNRTVSPGHSSNVQVCPASSPQPAASLLVCSPPTVTTPTPTPSPTTAAPAPSSPVPTAVTPTSPFTTTPPNPASIVVNGGNAKATTRIVSIVVSPPPGAVTVVLFNPAVLGSSSVSFPAIATTTSWDLCTGEAVCGDGTHTVSGYFVGKGGEQTPVLTTKLNLALLTFPSGPEVSPVSNFDLMKGLTSGAMSIILDSVKTLGIAAGFGGILWTLFSTLRTFSDIPALIARAFGTLLPFGYLRRRDRAWGTVYDSKTRRPLDPAIVTLYDASGKELKTVITDLDGRFGFLANPGTYTINAQKGHHSFPAKDLPALDPVYPHPYTGGAFEVGNEGVIIKDIPLDLVDFDWNEYEKYRRGLYHFFSRFDRPLAWAALVLTPLGALVSLVELVRAPSLLNVLIIVAYGVIGLLYLAGLAPRLYGALKDADGEPLAFSVVKAFRPGADSTGSKAVTDHLGRYYLLLPAGTEFDIQVEELAGPNTYTPVWKRRYDHLRGHFNRVIHVPHV